MAVGKESIKRAASAGSKKTTAAKAEKADVKTSVLTPMNADELQSAFTPKKPTSTNGTIGVMEELPVYLL